MSLEGYAVPSPIMIMGIMACGKSRIGAEIAQRLGAEYIEGDDWHPAPNVEKMRSGVPLSDEDRWPWLDQLAMAVRDKQDADVQVVFSCSALKRVYRDRLRQTLPNLQTVCLMLDAETAARRASGRADHFMPTALVDSQLAAFEAPEADPRTAIVDASAPFDRVLMDVERALRKL